MFSKPTCFLAVLAMAAAVQAQISWTEPVAPQIGQDLTVYYDSAEGAVPAGNVRLHWGVYDPESTDWLTPPEANWPTGSQLHTDGVALQSPMADQGDGVYAVVLPSTEPMEHIAYVFTDGSNWESNQGANWIVDYVEEGLACWWTPEEPETGDTVTLYYDTGPGTLPDGASVQLHWGVNEFGFGNWNLPPEEMWPAGTVAQGEAARTPLVDEGDGLWSLSITPVDTINTLHWVFTDGSNWDNNDGANWNLSIGDAPVYYEVPVHFELNPQSTFFSGPTEITAVTVAGQFNSWNMSANPMTDRGDGVWYADITMQEGVYNYKFVVNGENWQGDPDNPAINSNDNNNSIIEVVASDHPRLKRFNLPYGRGYSEPESVNLAASFFPTDTVAAFDWAATTVYVNGTSVDFDHDDDSIYLNVDLITGMNVVNFMVYDVNGGMCNTDWRAVVMSNAWYHADFPGDDDGPGFYEYPTPNSGYADIAYVALSEAADGDSLHMRIMMMSMPTDYTKLACMILPTLENQAEGDHISEELNTPAWSGAGGVFLSLMLPTAGSLDPEQDHRLVFSADPFEASDPIPVWQSGLALIASLPMDLLESRLGGWSAQWYFGVWSMIDGVMPVDQGCFEIGEPQGALAEYYDCDVYDLAFTNTRWEENRILGNYFLGRTATIDGTGRGFAAVLPEQVGPNMMAPGPRLQILTQGATTIQQWRSIAGTVSDNLVGDVGLVRFSEQGSDTSWANAIDGEWSYGLALHEGVNTFQAIGQDEEGEWGTSATIDYIYEVNHAPLPNIAMSQNGEGHITLSGGNTMDVDGDIAAWQWEAEAGNPETLTLINATAMNARIEELPDSDGEYWLRLTVTDSAGNSDYARCLFEVEDGSVHLVSDDGYPLWVRDAIIYEIFVRSFDTSRTLAGVTDRLDELVDLGVNCIWFMPIFEGPSDHGYEITDYYSIESDYGTLEDLEELVAEAHERDIRVVLDMVINHSGIGHAWMQSALSFGDYSQYHDYYMFNQQGEHEYYYDWYSLPNFNVSDANLRHEIYAMSRYWVEDIGVDGYRCDVAWGPMERDASFWTEWRKSIRRKRPDLLLLAEAGAGDFSIFDNRFNLAYDWDFFHNVVRNLDTVTPGTVQDRISNVGFWFPDNGLPFRFLENHDEERYLVNYTLAQTKMAADLVMSAPGIPLIYAGQEVGETSQRGLIDWNDSQNLRPHYQRLCAIRNEFKALRTNTAQQLTVSTPSQVYAMARVGEDPQSDGVVLAAFNLSGNERDETLTLTPADWGMDTGVWYATNLMTGETMEFSTGVPSSLAIEMAEWGSRLLWLGPSTAILPDPETGAHPVDFELGKAYPNPFNPTTAIPFQLPAPEENLRLAVYDLLGREVEVLLEGPVAAGSHLVHWQANRHASGVYFLQLQGARQVETQKVLLLK